MIFPLKKREFLHRFLDIIFSLILLSLLCPFFLIITLLIVTFSIKPILIIDPCVSRKYILFPRFRFNTSATYLTRSQISHYPPVFIVFVFKLIEITRLNRVPQLFNILAGDMSFFAFKDPLLHSYLVDLQNE